MRLLQVSPKVYPSSSQVTTRLNKEAQKEGELVSCLNSYLLEFAGNTATHTARAKRYDLGRFESFILTYTGKSKASLSLEDFSHSAVSAFVDDLLERGESPATVSRRLATIKHFARMLAESRRDFVNPARQVKAPKADVLKPHGLSADELRSVAERTKERVAARPTFSRLRDATLVQLLFETGLRADEVRMLRLKQLDSDLSRISNVRTKGKRFRTVYIPSTMRKSLEGYLTARERELRRFFTVLPRNVNDDLPVFVSTYGVKPERLESFLLAPKTVWRAVRSASVDKKLHPHLLRHSFALELLDETKDIRLVSQALGHSDVRVTMRYTEREDAEIAAALERRRTRAEKK